MPSELFDWVILKPAKVATEASKSWKFGCSNNKYYAFSAVITTVIRLLGCPDWSASLLFAYVLSRFGAGHMF